MGRDQQAMTLAMAAQNSGQRSDPTTPAQRSKESTGTSCVGPLLEARAVLDHEEGEDGSDDRSRHHFEEDDRSREDAAGGGS